MTTHTESPASPVKKPWYKEFWLWFILSPIITVVLVSSITITIAVSGADEVVDGPYIKKGRMLHLKHINAEETKRADPPSKSTPAK